MTRLSHLNDCFVLANSVRFYIAGNTVMYSLFKVLGQHLNFRTKTKTPARERRGGPVKSRNSGHLPDRRRSAVAKDIEMMDSVDLWIESLNPESMI